EVELKFAAFQRHLGTRLGEGDAESAQTGTAIGFGFPKISKRPRGTATEGKVQYARSGRNHGHVVIRTEKARIVGAIDERLAAGDPGGTDQRQDKKGDAALHAPASMRRSLLGLNGAAGLFPY